jgi:hypothetical protein
MSSDLFNKVMLWVISLGISFLGALIVMVLGEMVVGAHSDWMLLVMFIMLIVFFVTLYVAIKQGYKRLFKITLDR